MKKITIVLLFCFCAVGFSQAQTGSDGGDNATSNHLQSITAPKGAAVTKVPKASDEEFRAVSLEGFSRIPAEPKAANQEFQALSTGGLTPSYLMNSGTSSTLLEQTPEMEAELLAYQNWLATQPASIISGPTNLSSRSPMADIIPTAGATETFSVAVGDNFFDPGGPGGSNTGGTPGNYPNCGCVTTSTLDGATEIEFLFFSVFATFDWLKIYDSADTSGAVLYDNATGGANQGDITLADMIASNGSGSFVGTSGSLTFEFNATAVVDYGGWDVEIIASSGGGGGGTSCNQEHLVSANPGGGVGSSVDSAFNSATDLVVAMGEDFTIDTIDATFLTFAPADPPTTANIVYYEDNAGLPGAMIGSETVVPTIVSAQPWVNPIADQYVTTMAVTPFTFAGDAASDTTYWIEITMGTATNQATVFWEYNRDGIVGNPVAQFDGAAWAYPDLDQDGNPDLDAEAIYNYAGQCEPISVPTDNDTCGDATAVACGDVVVSDTLTNTDTGGNPAPDEWFKFTGTGAAEIVTISLCDGGTDYDSLLRVFSDCTLANEIAFNDDSCGLQSELTFGSDGTSTYYIMVEGFGASAGNFSMAVTCVPAEVNDDCENALPISCGEIVAGSTVNASPDGAVAPECDTTVTAPGVWYTYEDTTGLVTDITISMCNGNTDYDSKLSVYTGDCNDLVCVVGNDDTCGLQSEVSFQSDGATTFYILVHGFGGATGNFEIDMTCTPVPPPNDLIANAIDLSNETFPYTDPSVAMPAATIEAGNPTGCNLDGANGVWYKGSPLEDGTMTGTITTPGGASAITFYEAPSLNAVESELVLVDWFQNQCLPGTTATIPATAGTNYYVFVLNSGAVTDIVFDWVPLLGTNENTIEGFSYYPNPAESTLNLSAEDTIDSVIIYNMLGQKLIDQNVDAVSSELNISNLATGAYLMKVSVNGQIGTYQVLKK